MSCFVMSPKDLAMIANGLQKLLNMGFNYCGIEAPKELYEALRKTCTIERGFFFSSTLIYQALYNLNAAAYSGRYRQEINRSAPAIEVQDYQLFTRCEYDPEGGHYIICPWHYRFAKLVECYNYQVSEDATRKIPLTLAMEALGQTIYKFIVLNSPEYVAAPNWFS